MDIVKKFDLFANGAHAAVTTFADTASLVIKFSDHKNNDDFQVALDNLPIINSYPKTDIGIALNVALNEMFQEDNGMRPNSPKVSVLITDGISSRTDYAGFRNKFRQAQIKLVVVGIGQVNENDLLELVERENLHLVTDFAALDVTDFVSNTTFCEPDPCTCKYNLKYGAM